ncbi:MULTISPECIES: hypothetical protein [Kitasatospora]|jgi:hypothetical protein|nr:MULTISPECIES: hypothetical protein [Kitasatospora]MDH6140565.1 hypothetical protein [Kitasatospora sp. GP30]
MNEVLELQLMETELSYLGADEAGAFCSCSSGSTAGCGYDTSATID